MLPKDLHSRFVAPAKPDQRFRRQDHQPRVAVGIADQACAGRVAERWRGEQRLGALQQQDVQVGGGQQFDGGGRDVVEGPEKHQNRGAPHPLAHYALEELERRGLPLPNEDDKIGEAARIGANVLTHLLGIPGVRNYDGSWTEWGGRADTAVVTGPAR